VGEAVPGDHPSLPTDAAPEQVVAFVTALVGA
jgi:hypothetical protein